MIPRRVVVTGIGAVSPFGAGVGSLEEGIFAGRSAASLITRFDPACLSTRFAAQVPLPEPEIEARIENQKSLKTLSRSGKFLVVAAREAVTDADLARASIDPFRFGTSFGAGGLGLDDVEHFYQRLEIIASSMDPGQGHRIDPATLLRNLGERINPLTPLKALSNIPTAHVAINHQARGHCQTITTACTSSAQAIGEAYRLIKFGAADLMLTGGGDSMVNPNSLLAFGLVGVLSKNNADPRSAARPFDRRRDGFMVGEGAAVLLLEELEHSRRRGARIYGEVVGYASTCDAYRLTDEPAEAWGSVAAMRASLADAGLEPGAIDYINAHGTGTAMNDHTETFAIKRVFGGATQAPPVSSTKSMIGHLVAAAGAMEFLTCVLALKRQLMPPTINYADPDPDCDLDYVPNHSRPKTLRAILSNSFGFGGQNACLILKDVTA